MEMKTIKTTEIVNLFMIEKLVLFFSRPIRAEDVGKSDDMSTMNYIISKVVH